MDDDEYMDNTSWLDDDEEEELLEEEEEEEEEDTEMKIALQESLSLSKQKKQNKQNPLPPVIDLTVNSDVKCAAQIDMSTFPPDMKEDPYHNLLIMAIDAGLDPTRVDRYMKQFDGDRFMVLLSLLRKCEHVEAREAADAADTKFNAASSSSSSSSSSSFAAGWHFVSAGERQAQEQSSEAAIQEILMLDEAQGFMTLETHNIMVRMQIPLEEDVGESEGKDKDKAESEGKHKIESKVVDKDTLFDCVICLDTEFHISQVFLCVVCGKSVCLECRRLMFESGFTERFSLGPKILKCPMAGCDARLRPSECKLIFNKEQLDKIDAILLKSHLDGDKDFRWCPRNGCGMGIIGSADEKTITCPNRGCGFQYCYACKEDHGGVTCETFQKWKSQNLGGDARFHDWVVQNGAKPCPKCKIIIQKNGGCDHHTCRNCKHEYYWESGEPYR